MANGHGAQGVAERTADNPWLAVSARFVSLILAPIAILMFVRFIDALADIDDSIAELSKNQAVIVERLASTNSRFDRHNSSYGHPLIQTDVFQLRNAIGILDSQMNGPHRLSPDQ